MGVFGARPRVLGFSGQPTAMCRMSGMSLKLGDQLSEAALPALATQLLIYCVGHSCLYWTS